MAINFMLALRATQLLFSIIVMGLTGYVAHWYNTRKTVTSNGVTFLGGVTSPEQVNFVLFTSVWTLLATAYLALSPVYMPRMAHKFAILAFDALTMLFWFAGFIALAAFVTGLSLCLGNVCHSAQAAIVFGAFTWLLFVATTALAAIHVWRTRRSSDSAPAQNMEVRVPETSKA